MGQPAFKVTPSGTKVITPTLTTAASFAAALTAASVASAVAHTNLLAPAAALAPAALATTLTAAAVTSALATPVAATFAAALAPAALATTFTAASVASAVAPPTARQLVTHSRAIELPILSHLLDVCVLRYSRLIRGGSRCTIPSKGLQGPHNLLRSRRRRRNGKTQNRER